MSATLVIGGLIALIGVVLLLNLIGAGDFVMRTVTSRYLGSLPPGFAASKSGFRVYAALVIAIGLVFAGLGVAETSVTAGIVVFAIGAAAFVVLSVLAIRGEVATARGLKP
ncbi:MAG TPA: hypothetical protein VGK28_04440 [Candidatus Dormibacteraeota bacterium]